ncbi:MAG: hypothetical protein ACI9MC_000274 [Kiritimatiellia bacterium]
MFGTSEVIMFGIQAGVQLHGATRKAFIEKTRERELVLPLPGLPRTLDAGAAAEFFRGEGRTYVENDERVAELDVLAQPHPGGFEVDKPVLAKEYIELFKTYTFRHNGGRTQEGYSADDVLALTRIPQWREGQTPHPTALKRIAGTLVEIGIDYYSSGPGKVSGDTPEKRLLRHVIDALDDHAFSAQGLEGVVEVLFVATLDALVQSPELVSGDGRTRSLVSSLAHGLAEDVNERLQALDPGERLLASDNLSETAELVFKSVLRNSAEIVLEHPGEFLDVEGGKEALVSRIGTSMLDAMLPSADSPLDLSKLFTQASLDSVMRSGLEVVVEYPELLALDGVGKTGLRKLVEEVAVALLDQDDQLGADMFPELLRLVLDRTADNLGQLWDANGTEEHLLVTAMGSLLGELSAQPEDGTAWGLKLGKSTLLAVADAVLDEVAENPSLITTRIGANSALGAAVQAVVGELAALDLSSLPSDTAANLVELSVRAAASRLDLLDRFRDAEGTLKPAAAHIVEAILGSAFPSDDEHPRSAWVLAKSSVIEELVGIAFERLAESGVDAQRIATLNQVLDEIVQAIENKQAFSVELFDSLLMERLSSSA